jgi:transposase InsO family protein
MIAFIDDHRQAHGVEPICKLFPIAPSTYHAHAARLRDPARQCSRARRDATLMPEILRVFKENFRVFGVRKVWRQLLREGYGVARCTVVRLMRSMGLQGVIRGKPVRTTISDKAAPCPLDHVNRQFKAQRPNALWGRTSPMWRLGPASSTSLSSSTPMHGASSVGARRARRMRASCSMRWSRPCTTGGRCTGGGLVHHSDRGSQLGFNLSSQRSCELSVGVRQTPLRVFSSRGFCAASC